MRFHLELGYVIPNNKSRQLQWSATINIYNKQIKMNHKVDKEK